MSDDTARDLEALAAPYEEAVGFVPPRVRARHELGRVLDRETLEVQEHLRLRALSGELLDEMTTQLVAVGVLLATRNDAAKMHIIAAQRAGATPEQLWAVINVAGLYSGLTAANFGAALLQEVGSNSEGRS